MLDYEQITILVSTLAKETGLFIREKSAGFDVSTIEAKRIHDFVSQVDIEAEKKIVEGLKAILPGAGFITEEETTARSNKRLTWIVDPLDGTTNFIHGLPPYSVSIALKDNDVVRCGVVYIIPSDEMFYATEGKGAWLNGNKISVSGSKETSDMLVATGFPVHDYSRLDNYLSVLEYFIRNTRGVRRHGSAAADLAYVACGRFDGFFEYSLNPWDVSAGALLVREAGGIFSDFVGDENNLNGNEVIASNKFVYNDFSEIIRDKMIK